MNPLAEQYARLVLALGFHDADYVDAYYGPPEWRQKLELEEIIHRAEVTRDHLPKDNSPRARFLGTQLSALIARAQQLGGRRFTFDEESKALYDAVAPPADQAAWSSAAAEIAKHLPGSGPVAERYAAWEKRFEIPAAKVDTVFRAAIEECRRRTRVRVALPANENFRVEYVTGKVWSAYNWYKGDAQSLIQVNIDLPIGIDRVIHLAAHEGYPGHHVYNALLEQKLMRGRGWMEYCVYPLYSPQSLIAEGTADYGASLILAGADRVAFKRDVLMPLAGVDPKLAAEQDAIARLMRRLAPVRIEAGRQLTDGHWDDARAAAFLTEFGLMTPGMAERQVRFLRQNRAYIINYSYGEELIARHTRGSWERFLALLENPTTPGGL